MENLGTNQPSSRIVVIGAGLSGLVATKELVEEHHDVTCFEKGADIGGVFSDNGSYDSVLLTVSNYFMAYSDFMPHEEEVRFWTRKEYRDYLEDYVDHFGFRHRLILNATVLKLDRVPSGGWSLLISGGGRCRSNCGM